MRFFIFLLTLLPGILLAQRTFLFRNYSLENGLSQSAVTTIQQDETAALWIGTQDGLNRFDGHSFETFSSITNAVITNDFIKTSLKSHDKKIWFGTQDGIFNYDPFSEKFTSFKHDFQSALQVESLLETSDGKIWIGSYNNGLLAIEKNSPKITQYISGGQLRNITTIFLLSTEEIGIVSVGKLYAYNLKTKKTTFLASPPSKDITTVSPYLKNKFLIGTNSGLYMYAYDENKFTPYINATFAKEEIKSLAVDNQNILVGTSTNGLFVIHRKNGEITNSKKDRLNRNSLADNTINSIFRDKSNVVWVGTNNGISNFNISQNDFNLITTSEYADVGLPNPNVWCFEENIDGRIIFVGTDNYVSFFNHSLGKFTHCRLETVVNGKKTPINDAFISDIEYVNENLVLVSTTNGLYKLYYNGGNPYFERIPIKGGKNDIDANRIYKVIHWKDDIYFLGTKDGVVRYDLAKKTTQFYYHDDQKNTTSIAAGICRYIFKDKANNIHFFTSEGGMNTYDDQKNIIFPSPYNKLILSKSKEFITSAIQIDNTLWLGTLGSGLLRLNLQDKTIKQFNHKTGLPNNVIYGILKDKSNNLWMSSNKGLFKLNTKTSNITSYKNYGSFLLTEYNLGAYLETKKGEMFFGGVNGYNFFNPEKVQKSEQNTSVSIISLAIGNNIIYPSKDGIITQSIDFVKELKLTYRQNNISFHIMAQDLGNANLIKYKYILEGDNKDEVRLENQNLIHFSNLTPGEYTLKIYAQLGTSGWSTTPKILHIKVKAPFWMSAWFWIVISISGAILTLFYFRIRIERSRREQVLLEMKIAERTREIRKQSKEIEDFGKTIEDKNKSLEQQKQLLELEKAKTDKILKNILPEMTFNELKEKGKVAARSYNLVSVLFTDFVGFTKASEKMSPADIISDLDFYFSEFDKIIVQNNLEKIKTIGDAYMCAGGVPIRNKANPMDACLAALQIQNFMRKTQAERADGGWQLRIGINTGEIIAGVIGKKKLAYDIWGSTVNVANRIETAGKPGEVTISGETYKYIQFYFDCDFKEKAVSKYNELFDVYTVKRIKPELSLDEEGVYPNEKFRELVNLHLFSDINYAKAEEFVIKLLKEKLSPHLHYHSLKHTFDVVASAERLAIAEGITDENLFLLKSAALFHDAGFVEKYDHNEPIGARMAEEILPNYGYSPKQIETIKQLIFVTQIPHKPTNILEEIICDADLDYLGRPDFFEIGDRLRRELRENKKLDSDRKWDELQVSFLTQHKYFTQTAINTRREQKLIHLEKVKMRLETYTYRD
jgi:ligand-binding sensor domain-containing protein/class 3 adenylate cyclase/predicted metal-dependent HD superfamily phosphohydrolase